MSECKCSKCCDDSKEIKILKGHINDAWQHLAITLAKDEVSVNDGMSIMMTINARYIANIGSAIRSKEEIVKRYIKDLTKALEE